MRGDNVRQAICRSTAVWSALVVLLALPTAPATSAEAPSQTNATTREPVVVTIQSTPSQERRENDAALRENVLSIGTIFLVLVTFGLWTATYQVAKDASKNAVTQSSQMGQQIQAATENSKALREVAEATRNNAVLMSDMLRMQMRAYIAVNIGQGYYQEGNVRFGAEPVVENVGFTPAKNISYWTCAGILRTTDTTPDLRRPNNVEVQKTDATINPRQTFRLWASVPDHFSDAQAQEIMQGANRQLVVWGEVIYEDIYGAAHTSAFCHTFIFFEVPEGGYRPRGALYRLHNSTT